MFARFFLIGNRDALDVPQSRDDIEVLFEFNGSQAEDIEEKDMRKLAKGVPIFCYPEDGDGLRTLMGSQQFVKKFPIVLTTGDGRRMYGVCLRTRPMGKGQRHDVSWRFPATLCILSKRPYDRLYEDLLSILVDAFWRCPEGVDGAERFDLLRKTLETTTAQLNRAQNKISTIKGVAATIHVASHKLSLPLPTTPAAPSLASLLERFRAESILKIIGGLLAERRIAFVGNDFVTLARCVVAAISLMYPFQWQHILLPVVPNHLAAMILSPVPYLIGLRRDHFRKLVREYGESIGALLVADIDEGTVSVVRCNSNGEEMSPVLEEEDDVPALDTTIPRVSGALKRFKHGAFNCVRLRRDLRAIRDRAISSRGVKGRQVLGKSPAKTKTTQTRVLGIVEGMEHRMGIYRHIIGGLDETSVRVACTAFFVRIFAGLDRFVSVDTSVATGSRRYVVDMSKFIASQPDKGVRVLLQAMDGSQMLERFVERLMSHRQVKGADCASLTWFERSARQYRASEHSWADTKRIVLDSLEKEIDDDNSNTTEAVTGNGRKLRGNAGGRTRKSKRNTRSEIAKNVQDAILRLTSNRPMHSDENESEVSSRDLLERLSKISFDSATYRSVWPVLEMRLCDSRDTQWRHGIKSLATIQYMMLRGSPRVTTDLHARLGPILLPKLMEHENLNVRLKANIVYRLGNDVRLRQWASTWTPSNDDGVKKIPRMALRKLSFASLHQAWSPLLKAERSSEDLLDFSDAIVETVETSLDSALEGELLDIFGADDAKSVSKPRETPKGATDGAVETGETAPQFFDIFMKDAVDTGDADEGSKEATDAFDVFLSEDPQDANGGDSDFDFGEDFGESLPIVDGECEGPKDDGPLLEF